MPDHFLFHLIHDIASHPSIAGGTIFFAEWFPYIALVLALSFGLLRRPVSTKLLIAIFLPAVIAYIFADVIKVLFPAPRPFVALSFSPLIDVGDPLGSFPSAHATFFFALAASIFAHDRKIGVCFAAAALIISFARIGAGVHWPVDVVTGIALGGFIGIIPLLWKKFKS